jgi:hypothetical protein
MAQLTRFRRFFLGKHRGGVAQALQILGLRGAAGPFDWMRSRCEGVPWLLRKSLVLVGKFTGNHGFTMVLLGKYGLGFKLAEPLLELINH